MMTPSARKWHLAHPMPPNATQAQRLSWHRQHQVHCGCRPIPPGLAAQLAAAKKPAKKKTLRDA